MHHDTFGGHPTAWREWPGEEAGAQGRALMLHCSLAHSGALEGVARRLQNSHHCRAFDLPGYGQSGDWDGVRPYHDLVLAQALEMIEAWEAPVDLIGHSMGGSVALRLAALRPDLVRRLVVIEPIFFTPAFQDDPDLEARHRQEMAAFEAHMKARDYEAGVRAFLAVWGDRTPWEKLPEFLRRDFVAKAPLIEAADRAVFGDPDGILADGLIAAMPMPVLILAGEHAPIYAHGINDALARRIPDARQVTVEGAGHMAPLTHSRAVAGEISGFLNGD